MTSQTQCTSDGRTDGRPVGREPCVTSHRSAGVVTSLYAGLSRRAEDTDHGPLLHVPEFTFLALQLLLLGPVSGRGRILRERKWVRTKSLVVGEQANIIRPYSEGTQMLPGTHSFFSLKNLRF